MEWHLISLISQDSLFDPIQNQKNRSSAQGLLMMTNGFGAVLGVLLQDGLLINILQSHLVARMIWLVFLKQKNEP
jgi:hypothetical protein